MDIAGSLKKISPGWFIVLALVFALWAPHLLALGMFMDGVYDALLAENLYKGISTFWAPQTIYYSQPAYWDNPPLAMWTLATCYKIFGDHYVVERIYSFVCAILQIGLIAVLWRVLFANDEKIKTLAWLPCLLWLTSPLIGWCYSNNMLENTMTLFTTSAIIISLLYINTQKQIIVASMLIAVLLLLAIITKGPVGLFPFAFPVLMIGYNVQFKLSRAIIFTGLQAVFFLSLFCALFSFQQPANFLHHYFEWQLKKTLNHTSADVYVPGEIFIELLLALAVFIGLAVIRFAAKKFFPPDKSKAQIVLRFLVLGLAGSLPIAISAKQRKFYLLPAMVPFTIAFAAYILPLAQWAEEKLAQLKLQRIIRALALAIVTVSVTFCIYEKGKTVRDCDLLADLKSASELLQNETVIRADWPLFGEWSLRGYLLRLYGKKLCMPNEPAPAHYYMTKPNQRGDGLPANAAKIYRGKTFDLYKL